MTIDVRPDRGRVFLVPHGELDRFSAQELRAAIEQVSASGWTEIVLDLRRLDFMDAGGVHVLEDARSGRLGAARFSMVDGVGPVALPLRAIGGERLLPAAAEPR